MFLTSARKGQREEEKKVERGEEEGGRGDNGRGQNGGEKANRGRKEVGGQE